MPRTLTTGQRDALVNESVFTTLKIAPVIGSILYFTDGHNLVISGNTYIPKLKVTSPLRMVISRPIDKITFELSNIDLSLGQDLIASSKDFENSLAVLGAYHKNVSHSWHDIKMVGTVSMEAIDGDKIECKFISALDSGNYYGKEIAKVFTGNPPISNNLVVNEFSQMSDLNNGSNYGNMFYNSKLSELSGGFGDSRYYVPFDSGSNY